MSLTSLPVCDGENPFRAGFPAKNYSIAYAARAQRGWRRQCLPAKFGAALSIALFIICTTGPFMV